MGRPSKSSRHLTTETKPQLRRRRNLVPVQDSGAKNGQAEDEGGKPREEKKKRRRRKLLKSQRRRAVAVGFKEGQAILAVAERIDHGLQLMSGAIQQLQSSLLNLPAPGKSKSRSKKPQLVKAPYFFQANVVPKVPSSFVPSPYIQGALREEAEATGAESTAPTSNTAKGIATKTAAKVSPMFYVDPFSVVPTPSGLSFILQPSYFGLIQERICGDLFALVIQAILWNQTTAHAGRPILFQFLCAYPSPEKLATAKHEDVLDIIKVLGLQNRRTSVLIKLAQTWVAFPPSPLRRYAKRNYPNQGDNATTRDGQLLSLDDPESGWEIAHLPGIGPYAIDSFRIFYRDTLRGIGSGDGLEPEWKRVVPQDKDLRAYLVWRWRQEGWDWNMLTGEKTRCLPNGL